MPIPSNPGDIVKMEVFHSYDILPKPQINVYHYELIDVTKVGGGTATYENWAKGLYVLLATNFIATLMSSTVTLTEIRVSLLNIVTGLFETQESFFPDLPTSVGSQGGDCLPPIDAYKLRLNRPNSDFRHGYKRLPGVPEAVQAKGILAATPGGLLADLADALELDLVANEGAVTDSVPMDGTAAQIQCIQAVVDGDPLDVPRFAPPSAILGFAKLSHQTTRGK
jgi:hypothetical protein